MDATAGKSTSSLLGQWTAHSLQALGVLAEFKAIGRDLYLHRQALNTSTLSGCAIFQMACSPRSSGISSESV